MALSDTVPVADPSQYNQQVSGRSSGTEGTINDLKSL